MIVVNKIDLAKDSSELRHSGEAFIESIAVAAGDVCKISCSEGLGIDEFIQSLGQRVKLM